VWLRTGTERGFTAELGLGVGTILWNAPAAHLLFGVVVSSGSQQLT
jgi:hypothetical protein